MPDLSLQLHEIGSPAEWQALLAKLPHPHPLQTLTWGQFKSRWGWQARALWWTRPGSRDPAAAAMVLKRQVPRLPFSILYVPKGPVLDYEDAPLRQSVTRQLQELARQQGAIFIKLDPDLPLSHGLEPETPYPTGIAFRDELTTAGWRFSADQVQFRNTVELDLPPSEEELLAAMKQKTRYNIRLAARKEVTVREGTVADLPLLMNLYAETALRDGFTIRQPGYYLDAWESLTNAGIGQPLIAEYQPAGSNALPLGAVFIVHFGQRAIYMYGASTERERQRMPNYLLQWESIRWAKARGCTTYDFWGAPNIFEESDPLWGVWRFKAGFNGQVVRHLGAWDYPARPFWYWVYGTVIPRYIEFLRARSGR